MKRTKIVCTIGPASEKQKTLEAMMKAGMNVTRLNMSHGDYKWHARAVKTIRQAAKKTSEPVALLLDLQGPKVRIGELGIKNYELRNGESVVFTTGRADKKKIPIDYPRLHQEIKKGHRILIADGVMECVVEAVKGQDIHAKVVAGGALVSHKGLNFPDTKISLKALTAKDKKDLVFGVEQGVDFIAFSFARTAKDVMELRRLITQAEKSLGLRPLPFPKGESSPPFSARGGSAFGGQKGGLRGISAPIQIIVKIEKQEAVKNFDEILKVVDGVMIARGDLALETPFADVPIVQKEIIEKCRKAAKPVIVATEMLASMEKNPRPTRAEISDVANAVIDHADAVMLSAESAMGKYPVETVVTMAKIITETEASRFDDVSLGKLAAVVGNIKAVKAILVSTLTGSEARAISQARVEKPILAGSSSGRVVRQLNLSWGIYPIQVDNKKLLQIAKQKFNLKKGDQVILVVGERIDKKII